MEAIFVRKISLRSTESIIYTNSFQNQQEYNSLQCTHPKAKLVHLVQASCLLNIASTYFLSWKCLQLSYMYPVNVAFPVYLTFRTKQSWFSSFLFNKRNYKNTVPNSHTWALVRYKNCVVTNVLCTLMYTATSVTVTCSALRMIWVCI